MHTLIPEIMVKRGWTESCLYEDRWNPPQGFDYKGGPMVFTLEDALRMASDADRAELILDEYMHELSEEHFSAGWYDDLEMILWSLILGREKGPVRNIGPTEIARLKELSERAVGWFSVSDKKKFEANCDAYFVPMGEWLREYKRRRQAILKARIK
jgi:hypothetical protein